MDHKDRPLLRRIKIENLLSFGPDPVVLDLESLNRLIGPNASGKSNLIEALSLLRSTPVSASAADSDLRGVIRRGGGASLTTSIRAAPSSAWLTKARATSPRIPWMPSGRSWRNAAPHSSGTRPLARQMPLGPPLDKRRNRGSPLVSAKLYIEGGAAGPYSKDQQIRCRKGFQKLLERCGFSGRMPYLTACGGRHKAYQNFKNGGRRQHGGQRILRSLVDTASSRRFAFAGGCLRIRTAGREEWEDAQKKRATIL